MNNLDKQGILDKFYIEYHNDNYDKAIEYLKHIIQLEKKGSFWLYSRLSSCHYELKEYGESIKYGNLAYRLKPNSPVVLWDYAGVLIMLNKEKKAIKLLLRIQSMEDDLTIYGFPTPNRRVMQSMKNDCNYQLG
jgi:tetratricopeptide (TPR) repeat protein